MITRGAHRGGVQIEARVRPACRRVAKLSRESWHRETRRSHARSPSSREFDQFSSECDRVHQAARCTRAARVVAAADPGTLIDVLNQRSHLLEIRIVGTRVVKLLRDASRRSMPLTIAIPEPSCGGDPRQALLQIRVALVRALLSQVGTPSAKNSKSSAFETLAWLLQPAGRVSPVSRRP